MMIRPSNFSRDLRGLLHGSAATRWIEESAATLRSVFSGGLGLVFQDGGLPVDGLADHLEIDEWNKLVSRLFASQPGSPER